MLTVSVIVWNPELVIFSRFLKSLKENTPELSELIVIDNASESDSYLTPLKHFFGDRYTLIRNETNKGYGQAHNQALEIAKNPYFAVMNDDIEFFGEWSSRFIKILEDKNVGQVGPMNGVCNMWNEYCNAYGKETDDPDYIEGSLFMMRTDLAREYKLFDPIYGVGYFEDGDLSLKLKRDGYKLRQVPVNWKHWVESSFKRLRKTGVDTLGLQVINKKLFEERWQSYILNKTFGPTIIVKRTYSFGDVFLVTPIFKALKKKYPTSCIILMTVMPEQSLYSEYVDVVVKPDLPITCNQFINLDYAYEKDFTEHIVTCYAKEAGVLDELESLSGHLTPEIQTGGFEQVVPPDFNEFILVDVGESWDAKRWNKHHCSLFVDKLREKGYKVATIGISSQPVDVVADLSYLNICNISQTIYLLKNCKMYVGHEGLLAHICQSIDKECVVLYTCTSPQYVSDLTKECLHIVETGVSCKGCRHRYMAGTTVICPRNHECTRQIDVETVLTATLKVLQ